jgi:hypothetical protein
MFRTGRICVNAREEYKIYVIREPTFRLYRK